MMTSSDVYPPRETSDWHREAGLLEFLARLAVPVPACAGSTRMFSLPSPGRRMNPTNRFSAGLQRRALILFRVLPPTIATKPKCIQCLLHLSMKSAKVLFAGIRGNPYGFCVKDDRFGERQRNLEFIPALQLDF